MEAEKEIQSQRYSTRKTEGMRQKERGCGKESGKRHRRRHRIAKRLWGSDRREEAEIQKVRQREIGRETDTKR